MKTMLKMKRFWIGAILLGSAAGASCWQHREILAWYYVRQLANAYPNNRDAFARRIASLEEIALPHLLAGLRDTDALVCDNMKVALAALVKRWGAGDSRSHDLVVKLCTDYDRASQAGKEKTLFFMIGYLQEAGARPLPPELATCIGETVLTAERTEMLRAVSLLVAAELIDCVPAGQWLDAFHDIAERGLTDARAGTRIASLQLIRRGPLPKDKELLARAIPLLADGDKKVRRQALLNLASENELVREEALLPLLHDEDAEVQYLCELSLRQRGLTDTDLELARLISHKDPATRMRVLHLLPRIANLNLSEWLRQLSHDPSPAVRAAAVRAAGENRTIDMTPRLREMAQFDPSEAVRLNAQFYVRQRTARTAAD